MLLVKVEDSSVEVLEHEPKELGTNNCTAESYGNMENKAISLTQYYSHFIGGFCDLNSQCVSCKTELTSTSNDFSNKSMSGGKNTCTNTQIKPKFWKCSYNCGKIFTQEKYMKKHILVMHEKTCLSQCKVCFRYLSTKARLKCHMLRHSGVKHLVCLICVNKRANDLSCIRHHLLEKHGIGSKHPLFHESYYEMSLKEISLMKMSKKRELFIKGCEEWKGPVHECRKSASHLDELKWKLMGKHKRVKDLLSIMQNSDNFEFSKKKEFEEEASSFLASQTETLDKTISQRIVTAENGMKLVKLPNGQFKKVI